MQTVKSLGTGIALSLLVAAAWADDRPTKNIEEVIVVAQAPTVSLADSLMAASRLDMLQAARPDSAAIEIAKPKLELPALGKTPD